MLISLLKKLIFPINFFLNFLFLKNIYKFCYEKKIARNCCQFICVTNFTTNFVGNTCEFYNFVGSNYSQRNYLSIKILRKNSRKNIFLQIFIINLQKISI